VLCLLRNFLFSTATRSREESAADFVVVGFLAGAFLTADLSPAAGSFSMAGFFLAAVISLVAGFSSGSALRFPNPPFLTMAAKLSPKDHQTLGLPGVGGEAGGVTNLLRVLWDPGPSTETS